MQAYMKRVVEEKEQLDEKLTKLTAFLSTDIYMRLSADERGRIGHQRDLMYQYSSILRQRIEYHKTVAQPLPGIPASSLPVLKEDPTDEVHEAQPSRCRKGS
jgi:hypothetical protein